MRIIILKSKNNMVTVTFDGLKWPLHPWRFDFNRQVSDSAYCALLTADLQKQFENAVMEIKRQSYMEGYHDGRAKSRKQDNFWGCFEPDVYGTRKK